MGHLKLNPPDKALSPRVTSCLKAKAEANGHLPGAEELALPLSMQPVRPEVKANGHLPGGDDPVLTRIAQRFAPGAQAVATPDYRQFDNSARHTSSMLASSPGIRALVAVLIFIALLPSLTLGAIFWLGLISTPWSTPQEYEKAARLGVQSASLVGMSVPERVWSKQPAEIRPIVLAAPTTLEVRAGEDIPFTIALGPADALPTRSIIAISGLPQGATLSSGRPYGEMEWNLRFDEMGDLRLVLPNTASGETKLRVNLIAPDGEIIAGTETVLKVTTDLNTALGLKPQDSGQDFSGVRVDFAYGGDATLWSGASYDLVSSPVGTSEIKPERPEALLWSEQAHEVAVSVGAKPLDPNAAKAADEDAVQSTSSSPVQAAADDSHSKSIELLAYVNLRDGPSSSSRVISVMAKGIRLQALDRKRGWVQVTDPATAEIGWVYAGNVARVTNSGSRTKQASRSKARQGSDDSLWTSLGEWFSGP